MAVYSNSDVRRSSVIIGNLTYLHQSSDVLMFKASALRGDRARAGKQLSQQCIDVVSPNGIERVVEERRGSRRLSLASSCLYSADNSPALSCSEFSDISSPATTCFEFESDPPKAACIPHAPQAIARPARKPRPQTICAPAAHRQSLQRSIGYKTSQTLEFHRYSEQGPSEQHRRVLEIATNHSRVDSPTSSAKASVRLAGGLRPLSLASKADVAPPAAPELLSFRRQLVQHIRQRFNESSARERLVQHLQALREKVVTRANVLYQPATFPGDLEADLPGRSALDISRSSLSRYSRVLRLTGQRDEERARTDGSGRSEAPSTRPGFRQTMFRWMMEWLWDGDHDSIVKTSADAAIFTAMAMVL
ncbi:hypothetical protein HDZ31DRAFT_79240 [Schizophyllum fasciatum]